MCSLSIFELVIYQYNERTDLIYLYAQDLVICLEIRPNHVFVFAFGDPVFVIF